MCMSLGAGRPLQEPEEGLGSLEAGGKGRLELPDVSPGIWISILWKPFLQPRSCCFVCGKQKKLYSMWLYIGKRDKDAVAPQES